MSGGRLDIIGLGPGAADLQCPRATQALHQATDLLGYLPYVQRVQAHPEQCVHASDNREEILRARHALQLAADGRQVAVVSAGDAGVFGMAAAVFEALEQGDPQWRELPIQVHPGISAVLAVAARLGAPLGNDFCVISLSDNLKPWTVIEHRVAHAAQAGLVMALYNPISQSRPWQLGSTFALLRRHLPASVPVIFARAISREDEAVVVTSLQDAQPEQADMRTLVLIGTAETRCLERPDGGAWVYTPRSVGGGL